jgi:uncharacterized protein
MFFRRKKPLPIVMRLRYAVWPARSFGRSARYMLLRLLRIDASAHSIAAGCAVGVFAVFTPFLGLQMTIGAILAIALRGSILASAVGSFAGNPVTYPIIWISTFTLGNVLLGSTASAEISTLSNGAEALGRSIREASPDGVASAIHGLWPILKPMALGSLPLGGLSALLTYFFVRQLAAAPKRVCAMVAASKRTETAHR